MKRLNADDFKKLCKLAHIRLPDKKADALMNDCNQLLQHIDLLNEVDTDAIDAQFTLPEHGDLPMHEDRVYTFFTVEEALSNAPEKQGDYFKVPDVIDSKKQGGNS